MDTFLVAVFETEESALRFRALEHAAELIDSSRALAG